MKCHKSGVNQYLKESTIRKLNVKIIYIGKRKGWSVLTFVETYVQVEIFHNLMQSNSTVIYNHDLILLLSNMQAGNN